jgi:PAS domain
LKSPEETIEQKQQRPNRYKDLLIISAPVKDDSDESSSVLCLITLPEDDQSMDTTMPPGNEQLTIRIARDGRIIKLDTSQLRPHFVTFLAKEIGHKIEEIVHPNDHQRLKIHLKEVIEGQSDAQLTNYRIRLGPECYVHAKVQSRMFCSGVPDEPDFVMAVHEILSDNEVMALDGGPLSGIMSAMQPNTSQSLAHSQGALGGPLMTSVINGGPLPHISPRNGPNSLLNDNNSLLPPTSNDTFYNPDVYSELYFDMEQNYFDSRPESRQSMASVSTTRPSSATAAFSPATAPMCPSPLTPYHNSQPSPASITNNNNTNMTNNNLANSNVAGSSNQNGSSGFNSAGSNSSNNFQFSFEDKEKVQEQLQKMQQENSSSSERLRNLLMKSPSGSGIDPSDQEHARNKILKVS